MCPPKPSSSTYQCDSKLIIQLPYLITHVWQTTILCRCKMPCAVRETIVNMSVASADNPSHLRGHLLVEDIVFHSWAVSNSYLFVNHKIIMCVQRAQFLDIRPIPELLEAQLLAPTSHGPQSPPLRKHQEQPTPCNDYRDGVEVLRAFDQPIVIPAKPCINVMTNCPLVNVPARDYRI
jgi:hypothetical protein